ncbi:hypothetical protein JCM17960_34330 [Magnetospira thiophila]
MLVLDGVLTIHSQESNWREAGSLDFPREFTSVISCPFDLPVTFYRTRMGLLFFFHMAIAVCHVNT